MTQGELGKKVGTSGEVQGLDEENRAHIFATINAFIKAEEHRRFVDTKKPNLYRIGLSQNIH